MDLDRIRREKTTLDQRYDVKWADFDTGAGIVILDFPFPTGWTPDEAPALIRYPKPYPQIQPAMYIREEMEYDGTVRHRHPTDLTGWVRWCTHPLNWTRKHNLGKFLQLMGASLSYPAEPDPYTIVDEDNA